MTSKRLLMFALLGLALLFGLWYVRGPHALAALVVLVLPPLLLAIAAWRGWARAGFVGGVFALFWFSHGVMLAWSEPSQRAFALLEILLALAVVLYVPAARRLFRFEAPSLTVLLACLAGAALIPLLLAVAGRWRRPDAGQ